MEIEEVQLTRKEQLIVLAKATYNFLPLAPICTGISVAYTFQHYIGCNIKAHNGTPESLGVQLFVSIMLGFLSVIVGFGLLPMIYKDLWKDTICNGFKKQLKYHRLDMQEKVLKETDEIILQQRRK